MMAFEIRRVFRHVSNSLLREFFAKLGQEPAVPWDGLPEARIAPIFDAWVDLSEFGRRATETVLQDIDELAQEDGVRVLLEEALLEDEAHAALHQVAKPHDKAMCAYLHFPTVWDAAVRYARADKLARQRFWITRGDMPKKEPRHDTAALDELAEAISAFFRASEGRGDRCQVEHAKRCGSLHYYFTYVADYAESHIVLDDASEFKLSSERRAFQLVFEYDPDSGTLSMYARGGKKVTGPLQEIFARVILREEIGPENKKSNPYELNGLLDRNVEFPTDPADHIEHVRVQRLRLSIKGRPRRRITLEGDPEGGPRDVYRMMDEYLDRSRMPVSIINATSATLSIRFLPGDHELPRSLTFDVTYPNSTNLKGKRERLRELGKKYLKRWRIDRT